MLTKKRRITYGMAAMATVIIAVVLLFILLPKGEKLTITSQDMTIAKGEEWKIEYVVSNPYAVVKCKAIDEEIVEITNFKVTALKEGTTRVAIVAKYKDEIAKCICEITVVKGEDEEDPSEDVNVPNTPIKPSEDDTEPKKPTEPQEPDEVPPPEEEKPNEPTPSEPEEPDAPVGGEEIKELMFELIPEFKCEAEGKVLYVNRETTGHFMLKLEEENKGYELRAENGIEIGASIFGGSFWQVKAMIDGKIYILLDGEEVGCF